MRMILTREAKATWLGPRGSILDSSRLYVERVCHPLRKYKLRSDYDVKNFKRGYYSRKEWHSF